MNDQHKLNEVDNMQDDFNQTNYKPKRRRGGIKFVLFVVIVVVVVSVVVFSYNLINKDNSESGYSAVFLTNNQVYFGKLSNKNSDYVVLEDVYYLRVTQVLQNDENGKQVAVPDINLIKLGTELHRPTDRMDIQKDNILFIQSLTGESDVIKAIDSYKAQKEDLNSK